MENRGEGPGCDRAPNHVNSREPYQKEGTVLISRLGCPMCGSGSALFFPFRLLQSCQLYSSCYVPLRDFARVSLHGQAAECPPARRPASTSRVSPTSIS